jgi:dipeptidase E
MELIITGGGNGFDTKEIDEMFAFKLDKSKPLLYIPIAMDNIKNPYPSCLEWLKSTYDNLGIKKYEMFTEENLNNLADKDPNNYSGIYIGGGNTPYLLHKIKTTPLKSFIEKAISQNIPIYGGSAGAIIFGKSIISSLLYDKNWNEITDLIGFNTIKDNSITCHYKEKEYNKIKNLVKENNLHSLIALSEKTALYVNDHEIKLIGQENALFIGLKEDKELLLNKRIKLD